MHSLQRGQTNPALLVTTHFSNFVSPRPPAPLPNFTVVFKYITSICIKPCYDNLVKAIEELWF